MLFRPCIDLHNGKVKQIVGSTLRDDTEPVTNFESMQPPSYFAEKYRRDNLAGGHVIMLGSGNEDAAVDALRAFPDGLQVGGGITPDNAGYFLDAGASHVIVTSYVFSDGMIQWNHLRALIGKIGARRLVLDLSCRRRNDTYIIVTNRWQNDTDCILGTALFEQLSPYCDEFLVHASHVEGMRKGIDEQLVALLGECAVKPITYAGGVREYEDLDRVAEAGRNRIDVTIGSALDIFGGSLPYAEVVAWFERRSG